MRDLLSHNWIELAAICLKLGKGEKKLMSVDTFAARQDLDGLWNGFLGWQNIYYE